MSTYQNKYFSILGDSISTLDGYSQPKNAVFYDMLSKVYSGVYGFSDTWWGQVIERLGGKLLVNHSWSGSTVCRHPGYEIPSYGCSDERTSALDKDGVFPDVILVFMGINDWGMGFPLKDNRGLQSERENCGLFSVAYETMLKKLQNNYPNAEIWCMTLPVAGCSAVPNFAFSYTFGGRHISQYCDAIQESAKACNCRVIDLYKTATPYDTIDGCHPNASGMQTLADAVLRALV